MNYHNGTVSSDATPFALGRRENRRCIDSDLGSVNGLLPTMSAQHILAHFEGCHSVPSALRKRVTILFRPWTDENVSNHFYHTAHRGYSTALAGPENMDMETGKTSSLAGN